MTKKKLIIIVSSLIVFASGVGVGYLLFFDEPTPENYADWEILYSDYDYDFDDYVSYMKWDGLCNFTALYFDDDIESKLYTCDY